MIPIRQTKDNCMAACWASILEVPLEVVPDYQAIRRAGGLWLNAVNVWLSKHHGIVYDELERRFTTHVVPEGWHLINVGVPTGDRIDGGHAIVGYFGRPVWDPHGFRPRPGSVEPATWGILVELTEETEAMWRPQWGTCLCGACLRGVAYPDTDATCVVCGCTDSRACPGGCSWVKVDRERRLGICSNCTEDHHSLNPEVAYAEPVSPAWARGSGIAEPASVATREVQHHV